MNAIVKWGIGAVLVGGGAAIDPVSGKKGLICGGKEAALLLVSDKRYDIEVSFVNKVQATGTLEPQELVDVGAQVTGEIKEFGVDVNGKRVDYGSEVKAGQLLARIDDTIVELDIKRAEASVAQANAQILTAKANISQAEVNVPFTPVCENAIPA